MRWKPMIVAGFHTGERLNVRSAGGNSPRPRERYALIVCSLTPQWLATSAIVQ
jgi:hypothetical protein